MGWWNFFHAVQRWQPFYFVSVFTPTSVRAANHIYVVIIVVANI
jgi:hypothetical protein